ncbi:hypothetical protein EUX98_g4284 [Antrodiella citrinella]|uniref:CBM1 domain-containing protein n=1 Tax=Antrodiella citrinella TaxID=2447956 RepID=A0A4S4MUC7_9APHY|nr:hypothetical protein EUX98_g4284 [Antrodiella citrinella]
MTFKFALLVVLAATHASGAATVPAQPAWGQCGGIGWSGTSNCTTGTTCTKLNVFSAPNSNGLCSFCPDYTAGRQLLVQFASVFTAFSPIVALKCTFEFCSGDSYTQTGFSPNDTLPAVGNPLGNPPYPGDTATGGSNWVDVDTIVFNTSLILTYNYAYGGATIDTKLVPPSNATILTLTDQVDQFLTGATSNGSATFWTSNNTFKLFSFWIGINDIGISYTDSGRRDAVSDTSLNAYFALVQKVLYELLHIIVRNFLFINVPPVDRAPINLGNATAQALERSVIEGFNGKLASRVSPFQTVNPDIRTWLFDANKLFTMVLDDPQAYGFVNNASFGGADDFWGNNYHPSSAMHTIIGKKISQLLNGTVW